jgi:hypothetical protein
MCVTEPSAFHLLELIFIDLDLYLSCWGICQNYAALTQSGLP